MPIPIFLVDAFTTTPFAGNPAAICPLTEPMDDAWLQNVAREMNQAETAFLLPGGDAGRFGLRWFTPTVEMPLCGHATLASAHALWTEGYADPTQILRFETLSGELTASLDAARRIELDFPAMHQHECAPPMELAVALGAAPRYTGRADGFLLCELQNEALVRSAEPDIANLKKLPGVQAVIITARAAQPGSGYDFISRMFAPAIGIEEDPVTGSAHCILGPYWAARLGRDELTGYQASARGGYVQVGVGSERVKLRGDAVTVLRGTLA